MTFSKQTNQQKERYICVLIHPYGERLDIDMENFYSAIGDTLKQGYPGTNALVYNQ